MSTAPYGLRLLVGVTVTALEETRKLPQTILMYPMTIASQAAHFVMRLQQNVAEMVIKGDETLESLFPPKDEQPEWATFDEDTADQPAAPAGNGVRLTEGRFALYSTDTEAAAKPTSAESPAKPSQAEAPAIVDELDYRSLTLAQLRARLTSLRVPDLKALLAYEEANKARAPFQTLLANRITRASAK